METCYECVFDGEEVLPKCDYAVRVCTDYIKLPKAMSAEEDWLPFSTGHIR